MTINGIGANASYFSNQGLALDGEGQLALLLLNKEEAQQDADQQTKTLARDRFIAASDAQVAAMHDEANAITRGAFFQAGASLTAAGIQTADLAMEPECEPEAHQPGTEKPWGEMGAGVANGLSQPLGKWLGDAPAADARADAKRAATDAQLAEWQLGDASQAIRDSDQRQDQVTEWLSAQSSNERSAEQAIIAGLA
jgi:hypothetical protein